LLRNRPTGFDKGEEDMQDHESLEEEVEASLGPKTSFAAIE